MEGEEGSDTTHFRWQPEILIPVKTKNKNKNKRARKEEKRVSSIECKEREKEELRRRETGETGDTLKRAEMGVEGGMERWVCWVFSWRI